MILLKARKEQLFPENRQAEILLKSTDPDTAPKHQGGFSGSGSNGHLTNVLHNSRDTMDSLGGQRSNTSREPGMTGGRVFCSKCECNPINRQPTPKKHITCNGSLLYQHRHRDKNINMEIKLVTLFCIKR